MVNQTDLMPGAALRAFDLTGKVALVTGASGGLGARFAHVLHSQGAHVILAARRTDQLEVVANGLGNSSIKALDLASDDSIVEMMHEIDTEFDTLDIVVNNAGRAAAGPAETTDIEAFRGMIDVNLVAQFRVSQLAARTMLARGSGVIVNVASVFGLLGSNDSQVPAYAASKGGLVNLTRELASEWAARGIRVNALVPGWFDSDMTRAKLADDQRRAQLEARTPMRRVGRPEELDGALCFLASDASSFVTGQTLAVDGGWTVV